MTEERKQKDLCPWCEAELSLTDEEHLGSHGKMKINRCARCKKLISVRLAGERDRILKKELIIGG